VAEANPGEVEAANRQLENNLQETELIPLPVGLLKHPRCPSILLTMTAELNHRLADWKAGLEQAVQSRPMPAKEAQQEAAELTLEGFLDRIT
jgi:hypothetical protein